MKDSLGNSLLEIKQIIITELLLSRKTYEQLKRKVNSHNWGTYGFDLALSSLERKEIIACEDNSYKIVKTNKD